MAHRDRDRAPAGAYDEDYHYYSYEEQPSGAYIEYKTIVAKNGTQRTMIHEELDAEEYFKRKLAGTLKVDKLYCGGSELTIKFMNGWLKIPTKKDV